MDTSTVRCIMIITGHVSTPSIVHVTEWLPFHTHPLYKCIYGTEWLPFNTIHYTNAYMVLNGHWS